MKVIEHPKDRIYRCTGAGNGGGGCNAVLQVDESDLRYWPGNSSDSWGGSESAVMFKCVCCGAVTDIPIADWPHLKSLVLDSEDEPLLYRRYYENDEWEEVVRDWQPQVPEGWKLAGKWDTDDGPTAYFIRAYEPIKAAAQADYETRIRSTPASQPRQSGEPVAWQYRVMHDTEDRWWAWHGTDESHYNKIIAEGNPKVEARSLYTHPSPVVASPTHRHKKRGGTYTLIAKGRMQAEHWYQMLGQTPGDASVDNREVAIYRSTDDGSYWVRPIEEFEDGRFEKLDTNTEPWKPTTEWPVKGDWMKFLGRNGYNHELTNAKSIFTVGQSYEVESCEVGNWSHSIRFVGISGGFNGVMFERVAPPTKNGD